MSYGENILKLLLYSVFDKEFEILERKRPPFLHGLELDFFIPSLNLAFEFQGEQHYVIDGKFIKSYEGLKKRYYYDYRKIEICEKMGILLITLGAGLLKPHRFRRMLKSEFDKAKREDLSKIVSKTYRKGYKYKLKTMFIAQMVNDYLKKLGSKNLTNISNRKQSFLRKMQKKELKII